MPTFEEVERVNLARGTSGAYAETQAAIDQVRNAMQQAPADSYKLDLQKAVYAACDAASGCRYLLASAASDFVAQRRAQSALIDDMKRAAKEGVPQSGHADPASYQDAVRAAQERTASVVEGSIRNEVLKRVAPKADTQGGRFATKMAELQTAVDSATADHLGPSGLRQGADLSLARVTKLSKIERDVRGFERPMLEIARLHDGYFTRGEFEKLADLIEAVAPFVAETRRDLSKTTTSPRYTGGLRQDDRSELDLAFALGRAFSDFQKTQMPESIKTAGACLADLTIIATVLVGTTVASMSTAEFERRYLNGAPMSADAAQPWAPVDGWATRAFTPAAIASVLEGSVMKGMR